MTHVHYDSNRGPVSLQHNIFFFTITCFGHASKNDDRMSHSPTSGHHHEEEAHPRMEKVP